MMENDPYLNGNTPPWDIGRPQPRIIQAYEDDLISGRVLDIACGTGEHAIYFAKNGHEVWGVDIAKTGINLAKEKAKNNGVEDKTNFRIWDVYDLKSMNIMFDTVTDSGFLHGRTTEDKIRTIESVKSVLNHRGRYIILGFHEDIPLGRGPPDRLHQSDFEELFDDSWNLQTLEKSIFHSNLPMSPHPAYFAVFEKIDLRK